jgi:hypothetical protein
MIAPEPRVVWFDSEEYIEDISFEYNSDDGMVASFRWSRVRVENHRHFSESEQAGILMAAMFFGP